MSFEYVVSNYNVPAEYGRCVRYKGKEGVITEDRGNYIGVTFNDEKPGTVSNFHPKTDGLEYLGIGKIRKITKSQLRYRDYLHSEYPGSFAEFRRPLITI